MSNNFTPLNLKVQNLFIKLCKENQWAFYQEKNVSYINASKINLDLKEEFDKKVYSSPEEKAKSLILWNKNYENKNLETIVGDIDFFAENNNFTFCLDNNKRTKLMVCLLENCSVQEVKSIAFLSSPRDKLAFAKWDSIHDMLDNIKVDNKDLNIIFRTYNNKFSDRNLFDICKLILKKSADENEINEKLSLFCLNHTDYINKKVSTGLFLKNWVDTHLPTYKSEYSFNVQDVDQDLFTTSKNEFEVLYLKKEILFKRYPIVLSNPATSIDYSNILENMAVFLNKTPIKKMLGIKSLFVNGQQQQNDNFIITIELDKGFQPEKIQRFFENSLSEFSFLSKKDEPDNLSKLKDEVGNKYKSILNMITLESAIPLKEESSAKKHKI